MARPTLAHAIALFVGYLFIPFTARAAEVMCDPAHQDCRATLLNLVRAETRSIDIAMWFMEDDELANAIIARFQAGVAVRALVDPRRNTITPKNAVILSMFQDAGIPMRRKTGGGILHWKYIIFNAQNTMEWSAANFSDYYFRPVVPYLNYTDEGIYFCDDPIVLNSFRRKFDDAWVDTAGFANYANISGTPARAYPLYTIDSTVSFVPAEDFAVRSKPLYDAETQQIDVIMYKITEPTHADGIIRAVKRGVPVRLIVEPERYRNPENVWHAYNVDRLYAAGVQIRDRAHEGFLHQKSTLLYGQGLTVFGSSNWSSESNRSQYEHNYVTTKPWFFTWFKNNFERKWGNLTGNLETKPFVPLPPDVPVYVAPAHGAAGISTTTATKISWKPGPWAHRADIYFGTSSTPPLLASNVSVSPNSTKTYTLPALSPGTTYYWRVVSRTMAAETASGPIYAFTTQGGTGPPPPPPPPACSFTVTPTAASVGSAGGEKSVSVSTTADCTWAAQSNSSFVSITSGGTGVGSGNVRYSVAANSASARTGRLTVAGQTVTIEQAAAPPPPPPPPPCSFAVTPTSTSASYSGGAGSVSVTTTAGCSWSTQSNSAFVSITSGKSGTGSGTVTYTVAANSAGARAATLTVAGQMVTIRQAAAPPSRALDFDGDGRTDISVFRPSNGTWYHRYSAGASAAYEWGNADDLPVPGDYDGDAKADVAVYRRSTAHWFVLKSTTNYTAWDTYQWGQTGDLPFPGDYDGDALTDIAVYRPSSGSWYVLKSSTRFTTADGFVWGAGGDRPAPGDYDGDGRIDLAVYRPATAHWFILLSTTSYASWWTLQWGSTGDVLVPSDYDGDKKTDVAVYRPSTGGWHILTSSSGFTGGAGYMWGMSADVPLPGDYDGDGRADLAIFRSSTAHWFILSSATSYTTWDTYQWGSTGDIPLSPIGNSIR